MKKESIRWNQLDKRQLSNSQVHPICVHYFQFIFSFIKDYADFHMSNQFRTLFANNN